MAAFSLKEAIVQLRKKLIQVQDLYEICLQRSHQTASLNIYATLRDEKSVSHQLSESQRHYDEGRPRPLEGIPISFKDNFCTKGIPTTCASAMLHSYVPPYNATMVSRCLDHGALLIGKTNMDEFAMGSGSIDSQYGPVKNPWSFAKSFSASNHEGDDNSNDGGDWAIAGGSSGGAAASVVAGTCLAAFGSDTGGSVRVPAGFCGVVGLKPTYGLLSRHGLIPLCNSLDTPGILTRTVEDCAIVLITNGNVNLPTNVSASLSTNEIMMLHLDAVLGKDGKDSTTVAEADVPVFVDKDLDLTGIHIGIPKEYHTPFLEDNVISLWRNMADAFENCGAKVTQVSLPHFKYTTACYHVLTACEVASNMARFDGIQFGLRAGNEESTEELFAQTRHVGLNEVARGRIMAGNYYLLKRNYKEYFQKAQKVRRLISNDFKTVFSSGVDFLLTPTTLSDAPDFKWFSAESNMARCQLIDSCTSAANLAGLPAINVPAGLSKRGLPLGLQLTGPMFSESKLLSVSHWMEGERETESG